MHFVSTRHVLKLNYDHRYVIVTRIRDHTTECRLELVIGRSSSGSSFMVASRKILSKKLKDDPFLKNQQSVTF